MILDEILKITSETRVAGRATLRVYNVADLVVPIPEFVSITGSQAESVRPDGLEFETLIDLITSTITPSTWSSAGGPGSIEPFPSNLSLVISQTGNVHDRIADLLEQLRRLRLTQVSLRIETICASREVECIDMKGESATLTDIELSTLRKTCKREASLAVHAGPKVTLFNGQKASVNVSEDIADSASGINALHFAPTVTDDGQSVRLSFAFGQKESLKETAEAEEAVIRHGHSLLVDVTKQAAAGHGGFPFLPASLSKDAQGDCADKVLLLITPQIIIHEEGESALSSEAASRVRATD